jgi:HEPN domain-containing protein
LDEGEFKRWMASARRTLESARRDTEAGDYNWACFKAHQAAGKALKALLWGLGEPAVGHSPVALAERLSQLSLPVGERVRELAARLSKFFTPTRYPGVWESGIPEDYYTRSEAEEAIKWAEGVIAWAEGVWRSLSGG